MQATPTQARRLAVLIAAFGCVGVSASIAEDVTPREIPVGIVSERPETLRYVTTEQGFMTPYTAEIPGTDVKFSMVPIPGGKLEVKTAAGVHYVEIKPFWIGRTEVTWAEYMEYMHLYRVFANFNDENIRPVTEDNEIDAVTAPSSVYDPHFLFDAGDEPEHPAVCMRQYAAKQYTKWLSLLRSEFYRLPSDAEWTYACRAGADTAYSYGNDSGQLRKHAWFIDNGNKRWQSGRVATLLPNAWGVHDMHGNAAEWVLDGDSEQPLPQPESTISVEQAIRWPSQEYKRYARGGNWMSDANECRCDSRLVSSADLLDQDVSAPRSPWWLASIDGLAIGFRIVRPLNAPSREKRERYWRADAESTQKAIDERVDRVDRAGRGERGVVDPGLPTAIREAIPQNGNEK